MSFFSNLLNPKNVIRTSLDPAGGTITALRGQETNAQNIFDPSGLILKDQATASPAAPATPTTNPADQSGSYFGNPNDPAYGSFTKPFDVNEFYKYEDPGYWFRLQQGSQGLVNSAAAGSGALSGSALKDLMGYNQSAASQEYGNAFNRYQTTQGNIFSRLSALAGLGQASASNVGAQGTALAGQAGQAIQNAGTAAGAGIVGAGNSLANAGSTYGAYQYLAQNPQMWNGVQQPLVVQ